MIFPSEKPNKALFSRLYFGLIILLKSELEDIVVSEKAETFPTVKQVSEILNVNITTLWRWNKNGYLKTIEFGGGRRYKMSDVKALFSAVEPQFKRNR